MRRRRVVRSVTGASGEGSRNGGSTRSAREPGQTSPPRSPEFEVQRHGDSCISLVEMGNGASKPEQHVFNAYV